MKNTPFDLTGKVAVITGSSRGIGRSSAELLAKLGAKVVISSRKADACKEVADGIDKAGGDAHVIACNISRRQLLDSGSAPCGASRNDTKHSSLPGLTRQSIAFQKMDARVKPAHDISL